MLWAGCHEPLPLFPAGLMTISNALYWPALVDPTVPSDARHTGRRPPAAPPFLLALLLGLWHTPRLFLRRLPQGRSDPVGEAGCWLQGQNGPYVMFCFVFLTTYTSPNQPNPQDTEMSFFFNSQIMIGFQSAGQTGRSLELMLLGGQDD